MNLELFDKLWEQDRPSQHSGEWRKFLEICESYLKKHRIKKPIVVELGLFAGAQKKFYEQILGAEHIGININKRRCIPDIIGDTHDSKTLNILKKKLRERSINILFIDASHYYEAVKKDFEIYSPLCDDIIALHDINLGRYQRQRINREVWKFWDELKADPFMGIWKFISIEGAMGTGVMIKK